MPRNARFAANRACCKSKATIACPCRGTFQARRWLSRRPNGSIAIRVVRTSFPRSWSKPSTANAGSVKSRPLHKPDLTFMQSVIASVGIEIRPATRKRDSIRNGVFIIGLEGFPTARTSLGRTDGAKTIRRVALGVASQGSHKSGRAQLRHPVRPVRALLSPLRYP
jgi:hypothetical protein